MSQIYFQKNNNIANFTDKIKGCLIGGAAGDALGYPIEFWKENQIFAKYGERGITEYNKDISSGKALISDDTQMSIFTADGLLQNNDKSILENIADSYQNWLYTQLYSFDYYYWGKNRPAFSSKLNEIPELYICRSPGITCTSELKLLRLNNIKPESYISERRNNSKGCGGVMRVAPIGCIKTDDVNKLCYLGAEAAAITHGHPLGFIPAAFLVCVVNKIIYSNDSDLHTIIKDSKKITNELFAKKYKKYIKIFNSIIDLAVKLSKNTNSDINNIHKIGRGAVAEETIAIALYCSLRYVDDFSSGLIAAVNHGGDSDSTGAVTGNILGAITGVDNIDNKWKDDLELYGLILEMSEKL